MQFPSIAGLAVLLAGLLGGCAALTPGPNDVPPGPRGVYFVSPLEGATVTSPFKVEFAVKGMALVRAGDVREGEGHHHLIIDLPGLPAGKSIPADSNHLRFGKAQTETMLTTLLPGPHTLTLQFGDGHHTSYGPPMQATLHIIVARSEMP